MTKPSDVVPVGQLNPSAKAFSRKPRRGAIQLFNRFSLRHKQDTFTVHSARIDAEIIEPTQRLG